MPLQEGASKAGDIQAVNLGLGESRESQMDLLAHRRDAAPEDGGEVALGPGTGDPATESVGVGGTDRLYGGSTSSA